jgi:transcriptional regulator with XRE-family HTH domain
MIIGQRLQELRSARGWSQGDIEKRTGLFRCYISRVENGHTIPSLETLERLASAFEIELYQLFFTGDGKPKQVSGSTGSASDPEERKLLDAFRGLDKRNRRLVLSMTRKLASGV